MIATPDKSKHSLRAALLHQRQELSAEQRKQQTAAILTHLHTYLLQQPACTCALYMPVRGEVSLLELPKHRPTLHHSWALPVTNDAGNMQFRQWEANAPLQTGRYGIPEPAHGAFVRPDIVLTPLLGIDRQGYRLGYGKGYYDRYFASDAVQHTQRIGVAFTFQILTQPLPREAYDIPLHACVTAQGIQKYAAAHR